MKRFILFLFSVFVLSGNATGDGVAIVDAEKPSYFTLVSTDINVEVRNQVAIVTTKETFKNNADSSRSFKYGYPLPLGASATDLKYRIDSTWYQARIARGEQDTTLPGGGTGDTSQELLDYLGKNPMYFNVTDSVDGGDTFAVEFTYVLFLSYELGEVTFTYPNDYSAIQDTPLNKQEIHFSLTSEREITQVRMPSHDGAEITNDGQQADVFYSSSNQAATTDYRIHYSLSQQDLGLFGFSTYRPDSLVPDDHGSGYFMFVAEPNPDSTQVLDKVFTLIVDRSGSMSGDKMVQAKNAAKFIVKRLNEGDMFNIISFNENISTLNRDHLEYTEQNEQEALTYIDNLDANGLTNISGAFSTAISQFEANNDTTANIILFFTDGKATAGITDTQGILDKVSSTMDSVGTDITVFNFGIGGGPNKRLLTLLAKNNSGLSEFLGSEEVEAVITDFYLKVRNPVLLDTEMHIEESGISEIYPVNLPNLYKGQQMIVTGRYSNAVDANINLQGNAFGQPVNYAYTLPLSDSASQRLEFLPKIWAKKKIEHLMVKYHSLDENSERAKSLKDSIQSISVNYGVVTEFTRFEEGNPTDIEKAGEEAKSNESPRAYKLLGNYPNPFNPSTTIKFKVNKYLDDQIHIRIYNIIGQLVKTITIDLHGPGVYSVTWDGTNQVGSQVSSGTYVYTIEFANGILSDTMTLIE